MQKERAFSEEEEDKLQSALGVTADDLELIIQTLEFILQQVSCLCLDLPILFQLSYSFTKSANATIIATIIIVIHNRFYPHVLDISQNLLTMLWLLTWNLI